MAENLVNRNDLLAGVRQALGMFVASIPDHEISNFGEQFKLSRADRYWVVHVTLEGLCESRTSQLMYRTANAGENFFPSIDVNNFNDWSVSFNDDNIRVLFGNGGFPSPVFHDINGSFATYSCSDCGGQGQFQCDRCVGGIDECYTCRGGGRFGTCLECYGHGGFSIHPQYGKSTYSSPYPPSSLWRYQQCLACNASGNGVCKTCNGRGQTRCIRCKGTLVANCRKCKGTGVVVEFIRLTREFGLQKSEGIYIPVGLLNSCKDQINSSNDWRRVANGTLNSSQSIPKPWQEVQRLVGDLAASIGNCVCLRYTFNGLPVYHLEGQIEGLQASAWIVGEEGTPLFVNDPFVKRCKQLIDMAVNEWNRGKQDQAVITLRRAVRMSKRWQPCNTVFELAKSIPQELLGKARTPQFVQETLDGLKSLGKWMFGGDKTSPDQSKSEKQDPSPVEHPKKHSGASKKETASKPPVKPIIKNEVDSTTDAPQRFSPGIKGFIEGFKKGWGDGAPIPEWQPPSEAMQQTPQESLEVSKEDFVPPKHWKYQCPGCQVLVENRVGVCWNCNLDTVMQKRRSGR